MSFNYADNTEIINNRVEKLTDEVQKGEHKKDRLPNAAYQMIGERQADYFSHARKNMQTDFAHSIMYNNQQLDDIEVLERLNE